MTVYFVGSQGPHSTSGSSSKHALIWTSMIEICINSVLFSPKNFNPFLSWSPWHTWIGIVNIEEEGDRHQYFLFLAKVWHLDHEPGLLCGYIEATQCKGSYGATNVYESWVRPEFLLRASHALCSQESRALGLRGKLRFRAVSWHAHAAWWSCQLSLSFLSRWF